jgi:putative transposase
MLKGWTYSVAVLNWYSRYVISWQLDHTLETPFVLATVEHAISMTTPVIWKSD